MNQTFKVGDKVYFPVKGTEIYTLKQSKNKTYPLIIEFVDNDSTTFTKNGIYYTDNKNTSIFHATKENQELLSKLYGIQFEEPNSFLDHHLSLGSKILCLVCTNNQHKLPNKIWQLIDDTQCIDVITGKNGNIYISQHNVPIKWKYIYPIEVTSTGQINYLL